jgi:hypothetical protein
MDACRAKEEHHEHASTLEHIEKQSQMHSMVFGTLTESQAARSSKLRSLRWDDSNSDRARKRFLHRNQKRLGQHPEMSHAPGASSCVTSCKVSRDRFVLCAGIARYR